MPYLTEYELLNRYAFYATQIEAQVRNGGDIGALTSDIPVPVHINAAQTLQVLHTNNAHRQRTHYSLQEIQEVQERGVDFLVEVTHPATVAAIPIVTAQHQQAKDPSQVLQLIQHIKPKGSEQYLPVISFIKLSCLSQGAAVCLSPFASDFGRMSQKLERVLEIDQFKLKNFERFQQLTGREVEVIRLLCHGYNNKSIAEMLAISRQTVETHRKRLKSKLELNSYRELLRYALAFELVPLD